MSTPYLCAKLSVLAYQDVTMGDLRPLGMTWLQVVEKDEAYAFLTGDGRRVFLIFRGTDDWMDFYRDTRFIKTYFPSGGRVHRGFYEEFEKVWPELKRLIYLLDVRLPIIVGGHSLGGAMTQMAARALCREGRSPEQCHTFGCPKVGNDKFVEGITCPGFRWEASMDPVTHVPFKWGPVQALSALWYRRAPTMFRQPPFWKDCSVDSYFHSSAGYLEGMEWAK